MTDYLLKLDEVTKDYGGTFSLGPITLALTPGVTCIVGPNGAGKSTLFNLVAGIERPTSGTIHFDGRPVRTRLGYLPQEPLLPGSATCEQFLTYVAWLQLVPKARRGEAVDRALATVGLEPRAGSKIKTLSGGMRRRLGIAHAMVHDPDLLLLDEPTVALDPRQRISVREAIAAIGDKKIVLVSTHLIEDVRGLAHRVIVVHGGEIVFDGDIGTLERVAVQDAPGDTDLERAIASLIGGSE